MQYLISLCSTSLQTLKVMAHIIAPYSKLVVIEVVENVDIKPNTVCLIPGAKFMTVEDGRLILSDMKDRPR
jgi:two-component system CheB/CheR fusion protein